MVIRVLVGVVLAGVLLLGAAVFLNAPERVTPKASPKAPPETSGRSNPHTPGEVTARSFPSDLPKPSADYSAGQVVELILTALKNNDFPVPHAGVATTFGFASPENQGLTGPLERFIAMVSSDAYAPMLNHRRAVLGRLTEEGSRARQMVTLYTDSEEPAYFLFVLVRQPDGDRANCWLTDGVLRLTPEQAAEERRKDPTRGL